MRPFIAVIATLVMLGTLAGIARAQIGNTGGMSVGGIGGGRNAGGIGGGGIGNGVVSGTAGGGQPPFSCAIVLLVNTGVKMLASTGNPLCVQ